MSYYFVFVICCLICPLHARRSGSTGRSGGSYPPSTGLSGNSRVYTYSNVHTVPRATQTQTHSYPHSHGKSGSAHGTTYNHRTEVHHHYHYSPPQQISYGSAHHPVFHGPPPVYVYEYKDSGSRFDNLLTGLALYNLGRMSANQDRYNDNHYYHNNNQNYNREYRGNSNEICKLSIQKTNGEYEETRIDCKLMSSFIWDAEREQKNRNTNVVTKTISVVQNVTKDGNTTVTVQNTTIIDALQVKGPSIKITQGMQCFMIRVSRDTSMLKKEVECGLLQEYATKSLRYGAQYGTCTRVLPMTSVLISIVAILLFETLKSQ